MEYYAANTKMWIVFLQWRREGFAAPQGRGKKGPNSKYGVPNWISSLQW